MLKSNIIHGNVYKNAFRYYAKDAVKDNSSVISDSVYNKRSLTFNDIPGPKKYPLIGTLYKYLPIVGDYNVEALDKNAWLRWTRYGSLVGEYPGVRVVHVFDPDDIAAVFRGDGRHPARRSHVAMLHYRLSKPDVYNTGGLLATNGPDWWKLRSTFQKNFTSPQSVKAHIEVTNKIVKEFTEWIKMKQVSHTEDFLKYLNRLNLEVIGMVAFDERFKSFSSAESDPESRSSRVIAAAFGSNAGIMKLDQGFLWKIFKTPLYRRLAESQDYLEKVSNKILLNKASFYEDYQGKENISLLSSFLQQSNIDFKDITGMMVDILMAAIDTTAYSTSFALYHLSRNPECQEKLYQEIKTLLPNKDSEITADIISKANYTKCCLKESLRLNPVSVGIGRYLQRDMYLRNYLIPKNTAVVTENMLASRLPQNVRDPLKFKPERWLRGSDQHENLHPYLSLPFGYGPRSCIARRLAEQNMHITLIRMFREFDIKWRGGELGIRTFLINKPDNPISLSFTPRTD